ncbi:MAG: hypothetical protein HYX33_00375 [Actinobacteria bacterium]|nr:hypothetical protein [Actinomycetota bacterium]
MRRLVWAAFVLLAAGCSWGSGEDSRPTTVAPTASVEPVVGFDFSDALVPGIDRSSTPPVVVMPECFGGVTRMALVGEDLNETAWEVVPADPQHPPVLDRVSLGVAPDGFETKVPLAEGVPLNSGILVVNGPDHLGLLLLTGGGSSVDPRGCD